MNEPVLVMASMSVQAGSSMHGVVHDEDETMFVFGNRRDEAFNISFDAESLRQFIELATDGLRHMEQRNAELAASGAGREERTRLTSRVPASTGVTEGSR